MQVLEQSKCTLLLDAFPRDIVSIVGVCFDKRDECVRSKVASVGDVGFIARP
jgi:hypothetical protein